MRYSVKLFTFLGSFFIVMTVIYLFWTMNAMPDGVESVGVVGLILTAGFFLFIAGYLHVTDRVLDPAPEDDLRGNIDQIQGEFGFFSPHSWQPLFLAFAAALLFLGVAVGWWIFAIGVLVGLPALLMWTFEYFKGEHAN